FIRLSSYFFSNSENINRYSKIHFSVRQYLYYAASARNIRIAPAPPLRTIKKIEQKPKKRGITMRSTASSSTRTKLYWAITTALSATLAAPLVIAQEQPPTNLEEIQVTGSRIRAVDGMTAPTPVT